MQMIQSSTSFRIALLVRITLMNAPLRQLNVKTFPYHRDYGLPDEIRLLAVKDAVRVGSKKAAVMHRVSQSAINRWKKDIQSDH